LISDRDSGIGFLRRQGFLVGFAMGFVGGLLVGESLLLSGSLRFGGSGGGGGFLFGLQVSSFFISASFGFGGGFIGFLLGGGAFGGFLLFLGLLRDEGGGLGFFIGRRRLGNNLAARAARAAAWAGLS
jgi:hypothetical protein